jgi:hypothetical protein
MSTTTTTSSSSSGFMLPGASRGTATTGAGVTTDRADLERDMWDLVWPAVTQVLPKVFDLFRSEAGASSQDGRAIQGAAERDFAQFMGCVQPVLSALIPLLVDLSRDDADKRASRGEPVEPDSQAVDRFWGALLSAAIPFVVEHLPDAIDAVSGVFRGDSADAAKKSISLADREVSARFLGPLLGICIPALSGVIPEIFKLVSGQGRGSRDVPVSWNDFTTTHRFWDNDVISLGSATDTGDASTVVIRLRLAAHKTWWKGIQAMDDNGTVISEIGVQDNSKVAAMTVSASALRYLSFGKAKLFGIHTWMYRLPTQGLGFAGKDLTFNWDAD